MSPTDRSMGRVPALPAADAPTTSSGPACSVWSVVREVPRAVAAPVRASCPECSGPGGQHAEGCVLCLSCGWSACGA
jgi:hypothetical protein